MKRQKSYKLLAWKNSPGRKPLILRGARQVGKTWLMKEFGKTNYDQTVYVNFEKNKRLKNLFDDDFDIPRIIVALQIETGLTINAENTLIILDEIQEAPQAITALKYFCEDAPQYHIIAAGSLLGLAIHSNISFPVGKVEFMDLYPLNFSEFLEALGENALLDLLKSLDWKLIAAYKTKYIELLRRYYFVGGMPGVVSGFRVDTDFIQVRKIQKQILNAYDQDFSKHAPVAIVPRIRMVWNSIPAQLAKENRKFIYGLIKEGSRAKDYELALNWLTDCGQAIKIHRVSKPGIPLKAYEDLSAFKLFMVDVGLLAAMGNIDHKTIIDGNSIFTEFKGALTEQYALQQLLSSNNFVINYWTSERSTSEVDFVVQYLGINFPIEVKAEENLQAKSLKVYHDKYLPKISLRTSMADYREQDWMVNVPLYALGQLSSLLDKVNR